MQYDSLPEWTDLMYKVDANEPLDPVEQFIYDEEPAGDEDGVWRAKLQAALYFFGGAPQDKGSAVYVTQQGAVRHFMNIDV